MGSISLQIPQTGSPNSTEDAKVASALTTLQTVINGNIDDSNLASPLAAYRKQLFFNIGTMSGGLTYTISGQDFLIPPLGSLIPNTTGTSSVPVPLWPPDAGLQGNPTDFQVANKTAKCRLRGVVAVNATAPAVNLTFGLYSLTGLGGGAGVMTYGFTLVSGSQTPVVTAPAATNAQQIESGEFALPTAGNPVTIGVKISGGSGTVAANSFTTFTFGLFAYNV